MTQIPGYPSAQLAKAITTSTFHPDPDTRASARQRMRKWEAVMRGMLWGGLRPGSRAPVREVPPWATLEVVTGGFASGELCAGGALLDHERELLAACGGAPEGQERRTLNAHFLTDVGFADLRERLRTGCYDVGVPEEGALLVVAWLVENGYRDEARDLLDVLAPFFSSLRFYPVPRERPRQFGSRVYLRTVAEVTGDLGRVRPNRWVQAQKEAVEVWAPLYDRTVACFLETVDQEGRPCRNYPAGWSERALALLAEYSALREQHTLCRKPDRSKGHFAQLRDLLRRCARQPDSLGGRDVGRIRHILACYRGKRDTPDSPTCAAARRRQRSDVAAPLHSEIAAAVVPRLVGYPGDEGLDAVAPLTGPITAEEAAVSRLPEGTGIPASIRRKVERCLRETAAVLVERGVITSGETLARVLPQVTGEIRAAGIGEPVLRDLYAAVYRAFRRRRSLLLLDLQSQVRIEELPWVAAIDRFRRGDLSAREQAKQTLEEIVGLTLTSFPHAVIPNKLVQELRTLAKAAELPIPLVEELAADIFTGEFSGQFRAAARQAADLLRGTLYGTYYSIDWDGLLAAVTEGGTEDGTGPAAATEPDTDTDTAADQEPAPAKRRWFWPLRRAKPAAPEPTRQVDRLAAHCASRAGVELGTFRPSVNGTIIEQQQVLTTQNLAALFVALDLPRTLHGRLPEMCERCFDWICRRLQVKTDNRHARLIAIKNTACAWRQMVFYLSLLPKSACAAFLRFAEGHLESQPDPFRQVFRPALRGLSSAAEGQPPGPDARRFLGWTDGAHWLETG